jgi:hypothetical protein
LLVRCRTLVVAVPVTEVPLRVAWNRDLCILGSDEKSPGSCPHRLAKFGGEPGVPTAPQRRLIRNRLYPQLIAYDWRVSQITSEGRFVLPAVEFLQYEHPKEAVHLVAG